MALKVSIVIPTYNRPESLMACCTSVLRETGEATRGQNPVVELIVVDDGSTVNNAVMNSRVCDKYGIRYCYDTRNYGMAVARNRGIAAAKGEWIVFLDDDVTCDPGWYQVLLRVVDTMGDTVVGFEGRVNPSGSGVWDREVQNRTGGAYLTCHFGVRKSITDSCGMFDAGFSATGPYCEDHEFAARLMTKGTILYVDTLSVTHAPRNVVLHRYIANAPKRCRQLLFSDCYFYYQHPNRYRLFRSHRDFSGTYRSYLVRHVINNLKRRTCLTLLSHPIQTGALIVASVIEQGMAWVLIPSIVRYAHTLRRQRSDSVRKDLL